MASRKILVQEDFVHVSSGSNPAAGFLAFYPKSDNNFYLRTSAGVERRLWDSGNHGPGSGLNADLLDGQHGSYYTGYVQARGMNLVSNGSGLMDSNYNFPTLTFDKVDTHGGLGSFTHRTGPSTHYSNELMPVDIQRYYQGVVWAKAGNADGSDYDPANKVYIGIAEFDIDGLSMQEAYASKLNGATDTELALPLNIGDTTMTIVDGTGWNIGGSWIHFVWFPYTNSQGYTYPDYGYSRNHTRHLTPYSSYSPGALQSRVGNVITLTAPWPGPALPAGKHVRIANRSNGSNKANIANNISLLNSWTKYSVVLKPAPSNYVFDQKAFYNGTAYVKIFFYIGYGVLSVQKFSDLWFSEISANNLDAFQVPIVSSVATGTAPLTVISTTLNTNLNADLLDGYHASSFALSSHTHAYLPLSGGAMYNTSLVTNLNADLLDGQHASAFAPTSHNHSFAGLTDVALVSPSAGHTLVYNGTAWVNNSQIRSMPGSEYNTIYIRSSESVGDFGDSEIYMTAEEGIYFRTNIGKSTAAEASFDRYGIRSSKLMGTGERYLATASDGLIKVATVQPTQYWERDAGNFILSPLESYDEVHAWLFKAGGVLISDGYLETGRSGMYTVYNDMVVSEYYLTNNTFYYANSKLAFNNSTNLLTVSGGIDAGSNLIAAGEVKLTKQTPGGVLRLQSHNAGPEFLRQYDYAGGVIFEVYNGSGYGGPAGIMARASEDHSASGYGTDIEIWNTANGATNNRPVAIIRQDGIFKSGYGFAVGGDDGQSGTATILTGCSYNSITKTLIYTRASVTFSGGIVTSIASMSSLSVPLT